MSEMRLNDARLDRDLRAILPANAPNGLQSRIIADVEVTTQDRPMPGPLAWLTDADPVGRRRALLLAAALLLAIGLAAGGAASRMVLEGETEPIPDMSLTAPEDLPTFVRSTYEQMAELPPMTIDAGSSDGTRYRILVAAAGDVRIETYASPEATEPTSLKLYSGTSMGELLMVDGEPAWHAQAGAIAEDPRVFVFATMGAARFGAISPGCEVAISAGEQYIDTPSRGWSWVGGETIAGRPAHHVACADAELWIDAETSLTLRSQGPRLDEQGRPIARTEQWIEATAVELGAPPADRFELVAPAGVAVLDDPAYSCAMDPYCGASPVPIVTPRPAIGAEPPSDIAAIVAASRAATDALGPFDVIVEVRSGPYPPSWTRTLHDGAGRFRTETTFDGSTDGPSVALAGDDYYYVTETMTDGTPFWRDASGPGRRPTFAYPLRVPDTCDDGWAYLGTDLVLERPADHLGCAGTQGSSEYWIDRETGLVVRTQTVVDELSGPEVIEVMALAFEPPSAELFELPADADLRP